MTETVIKARLTFTEPLLGTSPRNEDVYRDFIGSKAPDAATVDDEVAALGADAVAEKGMTVFPRMEDGTPFLWDYQIKGFLKDVCGGLRKVPGTKASKVKAYKKEIDKLVFPAPRRIPIRFDGAITECQRPLRAQTMQGERVSLACSEQIPAGGRSSLTSCVSRRTWRTWSGSAWTTANTPGSASGATAARVASPGRSCPAERRDSEAG